MSKSTISPEVQKIINISIETAVKKAVIAIKDANEEVEKNKRNYFKETEKLLYAYPTLKKRLEQGVLYPGNKSKDVVRVVADGGRKPLEEVYEEICESRERSFERTKARVAEVEHALDQVKDDEMYDIIELHYFQQIEWEDVAQEVNASIPTVYRHRKRIVKKIAVLLFGVDAL